jgi:hypothetical protein
MMIGGVDLISIVVTAVRIGIFLFPSRADLVVTVSVMAISSYLSRRKIRSGLLNEIIRTTSRGVFGSTCAESHQCPSISRRDKVSVLRRAMVEDDL